MSNSNETSSVDLNSIKTGWVLAILVVIGLFIVGFYFFNFNSHILKNDGLWKVFQNLSADTGNWGTFGDYVGGILNPVIAAFAFYLIAKTYELQKRELKLSTDALNDQVKLAALTALLNSNLTRISLLESERVKLKQDQVTYGSMVFNSDNPMDQANRETQSEIRGELVENYSKICTLKEETNKLEEQIKDFLNK